MPSPPDLPTLAVGTRLEAPLLVLDVAHRSYDGGTYVVLTLGNATGRIESAPVWDRDRPLVAGVRRGHVVQVVGQVEPYRGTHQLRLAALDPLPPEQVDPATLLPSVGEVGRFWHSIDAWRAEIRKPRLARVLSLFYDDEGFRRRYGACPASIAGHHAALGGLLQHTVEVGAIARTIACGSGADPELLLAGVLLHDIGKLEAYRWDGLFAYADAHYLLGHVVLGALLLERRLDAEPEPPCTERERAILHHLILAHHGQLAFGSPVAPLTLEAEILHWADNASAKTSSMVDALHESRAYGEGEFISQRAFWQLDHRRAYRGTADWGAGV